MKLLGRIHAGGDAKGPQHCDMVIVEAEALSAQIYGALTHGFLTAHLADVAVEVFEPA